MNKNMIELPCNIGDTIYAIEDYNRYYDTCKYYTTIYNTKIVLKQYEVEKLIIDEDGVSIGEGSHDGINKLSTYHDLTLEEYGDCKIFYNKKDAIDYLNTIINNNSII